MHRNKENSGGDKIVSLSQPHIRPIVRRKAGTHTKFGAKLEINVVDGFVYLGRLVFNSFHKGTGLKRIFRVILGTIRLLLCIDCLPKPVICFPPWEYPLISLFHQREGRALARLQSFPYGLQVRIHRRRYRHGNPRTGKPHR